MAQTITRPTTSKALVPPSQRRLGPQARRDTPGQAAARGFSPPEPLCAAPARTRQPKRRGGVERIDRILAELLAHYLTDVDPASTACADPGPEEPA